MAAAKMNWKEAFGLLAVALTVFLLWNTVLVYPLKILVVFFHEMSHAATALATGGAVLEIRVNAAEGGLAITQGGIPFLIASSGYLGSLVWGGAILLIAARTRFDKALMAGLGGTLAFVTLLLVRPVTSFGFAFGLGVGIILILFGFRLTGRANEFLLKVIGITSCLYAILDIRDDVLARPGAPSDAALLAEMTGISTVFWGLLWIGAAIAASFYFVSNACRSPQTPGPKSTQD